MGMFKPKKLPNIKPKKEVEEDVEEEYDAPVEEDEEEEEEDEEYSEEIPEPPKNQNKPVPLQTDDNKITREEIIDAIEGHIARAMRLVQYLK